MLEAIAERDWDAWDEILFLLKLVLFSENYSRKLNY